MGIFSDLFGLEKKSAQRSTSYPVEFKENDFLMVSDNFSDLDAIAKRMYDSYVSNDIDTFNHFSNIIVHDIVEEPLFRDSSQPYLLGRALLLCMMQREVDLHKTIYGVIIQAIHSCLLKCRRDIENGVEPFNKGRLIAVSKLLCVFYDRYHEYILEVLHNGMPRASPEVVVHQFFALEIIPCIYIADNKNVSVPLDSQTDGLFRMFEMNNKHILSSVPDRNNRQKLLDHVHSNEDAMLWNYKFIRMK